MAQTTLPERQDCCSDSRPMANSVNDKVRLETAPGGQSQPNSRDDTLSFSTDNGRTSLSFGSVRDDLATYLGIVRERQDQKQFHEDFYKDIREAYRQEGNTPKFWNTLQKKMDDDLQKMVDSGQMTAEEKAAFDKVFMPAVRDVYKTDGTKSPCEFWKKLEDRISSDIKKETDLPQPPKPNDNPDDPPNPGPGDGSVKEAREKLHHSMESTMSGDRLERFDKMCAQFEQHAAERVEQEVAAGKDRATAEKEWNDKIKNSYNQLNDMVTSNSPNAPFDAKMRAQLAENAMYLFMDPSKENQGGHGTCWLEAVTNNIGLNNHPDDMARLLKEVATTGGYTDHDGKHVDLPRELLQFNGEEKDWTISNAGQGTRSPVGAIFDRTMAFLEGRRDGGTNGGTPNEAKELIRRVTGDDDITFVNIRNNNLSDSDISRILSRDNKQAMLEKGGVVLIGPGHMFGATMSKDGDKWQIHGDNQWGSNNDQLIGIVNDINSWNVTQTRQRWQSDDPDLQIAHDTPIGYKSAYGGTANSGYYTYDAGTLGSTAGGQGVRIIRYVTEPVMPRHTKKQDDAYDDTNPLIAVGGPSGPTDDGHHPQYQPVHVNGRRTVRQFDERHYRRNLEHMNRYRRDRDGGQQ